MLPISEWLSIAKDLAIVGAVGFLVLFIYRSGANAVKVEDVQALQKQLVANAATQDRYRSEINDALAEQNSILAGVNNSIAANRQPVIVRVPASSSPVPGNTASAGSASPSTGGSEPTAGEDIRPALNQYEEWIEAQFAGCRALKEAWPK